MRLDSLRAIAKGAATYVPVVYPLLRQRHMNVETALPENAYHIWLKHLSLIRETFGCGVPDVVAEFGPGDSLVTGLAALLAGARRYIGLDVLPFARNQRTQDAASGLLDLYSSRAPVDVQGWPDFGHLLDDRGFPSSILTDAQLESSLEKDRVSAIFSNVRTFSQGIAEDQTFLCYRAPYFADSVAPGSIDLFFSHSVLEHVMSLRPALALMHTALKPGGLMSHQFDLQSHGMTRSWDGHRSFSNATWKFVVGKRSFLLNRLSFSTIVSEIQDAGFEISLARRQFAQPTLTRDQLCKEWAASSDEDLGTMGGFVLARKP